MINRSVLNTLGLCVATAVVLGGIRSLWNGYGVTIMRLPSRYLMKLLGVIPKAIIPEDRARYIQKIEFRAGAHLYPMMLLYKKMLLANLKGNEDDAKVISKFIYSAIQVSPVQLVVSQNGFKAPFFTANPQQVKSYRQCVKNFFRDYFSKVGIDKYDPDFSTSGFSGCRAVNYKKEKADWKASLRCHDFVFRFLNDVGVCDRDLFGEDIVKVLAEEGYELVRDQKDGAFVVYGDVDHNCFRAKHFAILEKGKAISRFGKGPFIQHDIDNIPSHEYVYGKCKLFFRKIV